MAKFVVFDFDSDADMSWLEQDRYNPAHPSYSPIYPTLADMHAKRNAIDGDWYRNPDNHVALDMVVRKETVEGDEVVDSLGGIDFLESEDDWTTGTFRYVNDIPKRCRYQRQLAREAGLRYRSRVR